MLVAKIFFSRENSDPGHVNHNCCWWSPNPYYSNLQFRLKSRFRRVFNLHDSNFQCLSVISVISVEPFPLFVVHHVFHTLHPLASPGRSWRPPQRSCPERAPPPSPCYSSSAAAKWGSSPPGISGSTMTMINPTPPTKPGWTKLLSGMSHHKP